MLAMMTLTSSQRSLLRSSGISTSPKRVSQGSVLCMHGCNFLWCGKVLTVCTKHSASGHLKRFMRGISELSGLVRGEPSIPPPLESLTNGPSPSSSVPPSKQQVGMCVHCTVSCLERVLFPVCPLQEAAVLLTTPQHPPVPNPKRASQEESILLQNGGGRPDQAPQPRQDSTGQTTFSGGSSRTKNLVEQQRGTSRYGPTLLCVQCV